MVMDGLSAQSVGREFVRQYYTMLHEAPEYLHRFYSHDSSFLHDGMATTKNELPAIGQKEINKSIESLNFRDCHARIRQVDSQLSISGSVVIQVVGELSNNGVPLRRFMQTFVLVPQSPKKFYVYNDIFRYQDEVFSEVEENNAEVIVYEQEAASTLVEEAKPEEAVDLGYQGDDESPNGEVTASETEGEVTQGEKNFFEAPPQQAPVSPQITELPSQEVPQPQQPVEEAKESEPTVPPEKLSWAAMAKKGVASRGVAGKQAINNHTANKASKQPSEQVVKNETPQLQQAQKPKEFEDNKKNKGDGPKKPSKRSDTEEDASKIMQQYPDNQQVFIGNIPHSMPDSELLEFFTQYGTVLDIRVNRKNNKDLPNFGFVLFDSPEVVQKVLSERPLFSGNHRVNVEEKKRKDELVRPRSRGGKIQRHKNQRIPRNKPPVK